MVIHVQRTQNRSLSSATSTLNWGVLLSHCYSVIGETCDPVDPNELVVCPEGGDKGTKLRRGHPALKAQKELPRSHQARYNTKVNVSRSLGDWMTSNSMSIMRAHCCCHHPLSVGTVL